MAENPQAFPGVHPANPEYSAAHPGMTLRDWFAGQALNGLVVEYGLPGNVARIAYEIADAMLAARKPVQETGL